MQTGRTRLPVLFTLLALIGHITVAGDRPAAYAGRFYPGNPAELRANLAECFTRAVQRTDRGLVRAVIVPHAGYVYSGAVAASGFAQIDPGRSIQNVFLIGVSHSAAYEGAAVYDDGDFLTPLGRVPVNAQIGRTLLGQGGVFLKHDRAHAVDHSLEVQLPFLQYHLKRPFKLVPLLLGTADPDVCGRLAQALRPYYTRDNLFVVSTDLSHYPAYDDAVVTDRKTIDAVLTGSTGQLLRVVAQNERSGVRELATSMCGLGGVLLLQELVAAETGTRFTLVQYRNSGDVPAGDKNQVVGYAAITVTQSQDPPATRPHTRTQKQRQKETSGSKEQATFQIPPEDRTTLLGIARSTLQEYLQSQRVPDLHTDRLSRPLRTPCGAFVTLRKHGDLRGCIGNFSGTEPLARTVQSMAIAAATDDYRFSPVSPAELKELEIEISVLTPMRKVRSADEIELGRHGIYIRKGERGGTFLPQVATETGWSLDEFLGHCAQDKAGIGWNGWRDADLFVYEAIVFSEGNHAAGR